MAPPLVVLTAYWCQWVPGTSMCRRRCSSTAPLAPSRLSSRYPFGVFVVPLEDGHVVQAGVGTVLDDLEVGGDGGVVVLDGHRHFCEAQDDLVVDRALLLHFDDECLVGFVVSVVPECHFEFGACAAWGDVEYFGNGLVIGSPSGCAW